MSTTTTLAGTQVYDGPDAAMGIEPSLSPMNRPIKWATATSAGFHLALLFTFGLSTLATTEVGLVPELRLQVMLEDGRDTAHDNAPTLASVPPPASPMMEQTPSVVADSHSADAPQNDGADTAPLPSPETTSDALTSDPVVASEMAPPDAVTTDPAASEFLVTSGISEHEVPMQPVEPPAVQEVASIPTSQRAMLERQINKKMRVFEGTDINQTTLSWQHEGKLYTALLERHPAVGNTDIERVTVQISTDEKGKRLRTQMQMKRLAFSHFTQLVDHWDTEVQLHDDQISGRFHSNSEIMLGYDRKVAPKFLGKVTTSARGFAVADTVGFKRRDEMFRAGFETGVRRISLPDRFLPATSGENASNAVIRRFPDDTRIVFFSDGTYSWKRAGTHEEEKIETLSSDAPTYFIGDRKATLYVRGIIRGAVLVYSPERVVVEGSLVYAENPRAKLNASDYLGLASDGIVEIARPKVTGPGDIEIDAAIYARTRFVVTDEHVPEYATLFIYGNLTAGSLTATEPRYATKLEFDRRFETLRPPGFPMTNRYEIESWDEHWTLEDYQRVQ